MTTKVGKKKCPKCAELYPMELVICPKDKMFLLTFSQEPGADLLGQILNDRYEVEELVHVGGTSSIYRAKHTLMDRTVAVKVLNPSHMADQIIVKRFMQEAQACSHLSHQGVVTVYDFGFTDPGQMYLVMDLLEGTTLGAIIEQSGPLPLDRFRKMFRVICRTLQYMHEMGVIHRDLKPNHIVVTTMTREKVASSTNILRLRAGDDLPVLVDFRIARLLPSSRKKSQGLTQEGEILGTPLFMSPEQCRGETVDLRSDIYSLGCVMYYALTGVHPFRGDSSFETMQMHLTQNPDAEKLPAEVRLLVLKAMEKKPQDRFQSAEEVASVL